MKKSIALSVNGKAVKLAVDDPDMPLLYALRNDLGLHGPRFGCGLGQCGACTVLVDGQATRSCVTSVDQVARKKVVTLEGHLPNMAAVYLYPSLVLFEGTEVSVGRGTNKPFQCIGVPGGKLGNHRFTPVPMPGAMEPPHKAVECRGMDLSEYGTFYSRMNKQMNIQWLLGFHQQAPDKKKFFNNFFDTLVGSPDLRGLLMNGADESRIRAAWKPELDVYRALRSQYLLYPDFN